MGRCHPVEVFITKAYDVGCSICFGGRVVRRNANHDASQAVCTCVLSASGSKNIGLNILYQIHVMIKTNIAMSILYNLVKKLIYIPEATHFTINVGFRWKKLQANMENFYNSSLCIWYTIGNTMPWLQNRRTVICKYINKYQHMHIFHVRRFLSRSYFLTKATRQWYDWPHANQPWGI